MATHIGGTGGVLLGSNSIIREKKEQAQKRREQEARLPTAEASAGRALFGPPIQVKRARDPTHEKLSDLFGQYEVAKEYMKSDKMLFGADLQPPTPLAPSSHFNERHPNRLPLPRQSLVSKSAAHQHQGQGQSLQQQQQQHIVPNGSVNKSDSNRRGVFEQFKEQKQLQQQQRPDDAKKVGSSGAVAAWSSSSSAAVVNGVSSDRWNTAQETTTAALKPSSSLKASGPAVDNGRLHSRNSDHRLSSEGRGQNSCQPTACNDDKMTERTLSSQQQTTVIADRKKNSDRTLMSVPSGKVQSSASGSGSGSGTGSQSTSTTAQIRDMISGACPASRQGRSSEKLMLHIPVSSKDSDQQPFDEFVTDLLKKVSVPPPLTAIDTPTNNNFTNTFQFSSAAKSSSKDVRSESRSSQGKFGRHASSTDDNIRSGSVPKSGVVSGDSNNCCSRLTPNRNSSLSPPPISPIMVSPPPAGSECQTITSAQTTLLDTDLVLSSDDEELHEPTPILLGRRESCSYDHDATVREQRLQAENEQPTAIKKSNVGDSKSTSTTLSSLSTSTSSDTKVPNNSKCRAEPVHPTHVRNHRDNGQLSRGDRVRSRAYLSSSSDSGESSDDSDEESDTNSSDDDDEETNVPARSSHAKSSIKEAKKSMSTSVSVTADVDDDKQGKSSWGLTNFVPVKEKPSQVPLYASTTPEPVLPAPAYSGDMSTPADVHPGLPFEDDFDSICSNLLSDDNRALLSPMTVDKSGLLDGLSHDILSQDINDVFDSVIKCSSNELPELSDLDLMSEGAITVLAEAETHILSPPSLTRGSPGDGLAAACMFQYDTRPISPPGLVFCSTRPSVVVKLRRLPSRKYRSNCVAKKSEPVLVDKQHSNAVVNVEQLPDAVFASSKVRKPLLLNSESSVKTSKTSKSKSKPSTTSTSVSVSVASTSPSGNFHSATVKKSGASSQEREVKVEPNKKVKRNDSSCNEGVSGKTKHSNCDQTKSEPCSAGDSTRLKQDKTAVVVGMTKKQSVKQKSEILAEDTTTVVNNKHKPSIPKTSRSSKESGGKRKSDAAGVDDIDAKRFCDKNRTATYNGRDKSYQSPDESDSGGDMKAASVGDVDCCDTASASHLLTPPPSVVTNQPSNGGGSCVVDGRMIKSCESHNQQTTKQTDSGFNSVSECEISVTSISPRQPYSYPNTAPPLVNVKMENESSRCCIGRAGLEQSNVEVGSQSDTLTELQVKEKRPVENVEGRPLDRRKEDSRIASLEENRIMPSEHYLEQAKKLKHCGDAKLERFAKMLTYLESVLMFARHGHALEHERRSSAQIYNLYRETLKFCQSVCDTRFISCSSSDLHKLKLLVVGHRLQSFLHLKLYCLKRSEIQAIKRSVDENLQNPMLKPLQVPSPYNAGAAAVLTDTLSPISSSSQLTPSPAGSVSSVGSQNSDHCLPRLPLTNGHTKLLTVSQPVYSVLLSYVGHINHLHDCHEHWSKADEVVAANPDVLEFFSSLDTQLGPLHLGCQLEAFVRYFVKAFELLQQLPN